MFTSIIDVIVKNIINIHPNAVKSKSLVLSNSLKLPIISEERRGKSFHLRKQGFGDVIH